MNSAPDSEALQRLLDSGVLAPRDISDAALHPLTFQMAVLQQVLMVQDWTIKLFAFVAFVTGLVTLTIVSLMLGLLEGAPVLVMAAAIPGLGASWIFARGVYPLWKQIQRDHMIGLRFVLALGCSVDSLDNQFRDLRDHLDAFNREKYQNVN